MQDSPGSSSELHAAKQRRSRLRSAVLWGVVFQATYALWQFAALSMLYPYLGVERFGLWATVFSLTLWTSLGNLGLQYALVTQIGRFGPSGGGHRVDRIASTATLLTGLVALLAILLLWTVGPWLPWGALFNVRTQAAQEDAPPTTLAALSLAFLALPLMMSGVVALARQRGGLRYAVASAVQLVNLAFLWWAIRAGWSLPMLALVMLAPPVVTGTVLWVLVSRQGLARPRWPDRAFAWRVLDLLRGGSGYLALELALLLMLQVGYLIVAHQVSLRAVAVYAAVHRLMSLLLACGMVLTQAYWPTFSEAWLRRDHDWLRGATRQMILVMLAGWLSAAMAVLLIGPAFIEWWLGPQVRPTRLVIAAGLAFAAGQLLLMAVETPLKAFGRVRRLVVAATISGAMLIPLGIAGSTAWGVGGMFAAQALAAGLAAAINIRGLRRALAERDAP